MKLSLQGGKVTAIYSDDLADLAGKASRVEIRRASHVEPTSDGQWAATMNDGTVFRTVPASVGSFGRGSQVFRIKAVLSFITSHD